MFGIAGAAAIAGVMRPVEVMAGVPVSSPGAGILDEIDEPQMGELDPTEQPEAELVWHRGYPHRRRRPRRRYGWRRVCRRVWYRGRRRVRCFRVRRYFLY